MFYRSRFLSHSSSGLEENYLRTLVFLNHALYLAFVRKPRAARCPAGSLSVVGNEVQGR